MLVVSGSGPILHSVSLLSAPRWGTAYCDDRRLVDAVIEGDQILPSLSTGLSPLILEDGLTALPEPLRLPRLASLEISLIYSWGPRVQSLMVAR